MATADNPKIPLGDRMQAEVQLAYLDYAHSRFDKAIERFLKALAFFQWAEIPVMEGLIICGLGDIARRQGNLAGGATLVRLRRGAGGQGRQSHPYVQHRAKPGGGCLPGEALQRRRRALRRTGHPQAGHGRRGRVGRSARVAGPQPGKQGAYDRAVECWEEGALICKAFELTQRLGPMLTHLKRGYQALEMREELEEFDAEWNA